MTGTKIVFGAGSVGSNTPFSTPESLQEVLAVLKKHNVTTLDTAQLYGDSEAFLGANDVGATFTIDTKARGGFGDPSANSSQGILSGAHDSIARLKIKQVDIFYLHSPQPKIPVEDTLHGINEAHKAGLFKRFGLSNFTASDVGKIHSICKDKSYVLPSVYQGNYSAVARLQDTLLFPTLRKLDIAFYAYSPLAGGFLTKTKQDIEDGKGRFDKSKPIGNMYATMYGKPSLLEALGKWESIAKEAGVDRAELAYRWVTFHSAMKGEKGDAVILGASSVGQVEKTLAGIEKGPLADGVVGKIDGVWESIKHEAPLDNYHDVVAKATL